MLQVAAIPRKYEKGTRSFIRNSEDKEELALDIKDEKRWSR